MNRLTRERLTKLVPIATKHVIAQAQVPFAENEDGSERFRNAVKATTSDLVSGEVKCQCTPADFIRLKDAVENAVECVYRTLKVIGAIVDGVYSGK